jgi:hypothetical protein
MVERSRYFTALTQHVTCGPPQPYRIGNAPSRNAWGGDSMPPPPPPTEKERQKGVVMAPVPYDVPRVPPRLDGLAAASAALAEAYRRVGVEGGGGGLLFGLTIDHVVHAVVGTPIHDGQSSPARTVATLEQPLMALIEVRHARTTTRTHHTPCHHTNATTPSPLLLPHGRTNAMPPHAMSPHHCHHTIAFGCHCCSLTTATITTTPTATTAAPRLSPHALSPTPLSTHWRRA